MARSLPHEEVERLAERLDEVLDFLARRAEPELAVAVVQLVEGIERLHAEGLRRLVELLGEDPGRLRRAMADPVIGDLFALYDLAVIDPSAEVDPGGVSPTGDVSVVPEARLVQLERRLSRRAGGSSSPAGAPPRVAEVALADLPEGSLHGSLVGELPLLIVHVEDGIAAFRNVCPGSPLPLHQGRLDARTLTCPWHGCRFDALTGEPLGEDGAALE